MELDRFREDEHEKYIFGYSSTEIYCTLEDTITKCIRGFLNECRNALLEENAESDRDLIEKQIEDLKALYLRESMNVLDQFKPVVQNIFFIPPNAPIYGKREEECSYTEEQIVSLRREVVELEKEYLRERMFLETLKLEREAINKLKTIFLETKLMLVKLNNEQELEKAEVLKQRMKKNESCRKRLAEVIGESEIDESCQLNKDFDM